MNVADEVSLSIMPALKALALRVVVELTAMALEYAVDDDVGSDPSVVYLTVAPLVVQEISTL